MRKPCKHNAILPRGLVCDRDYLSIRLKTPEGPFFKGCGPHTRDMQKIAEIALADIRKQQYLGVFKLPQQAERWKFKQVREVFYKLHYKEYRDATTGQPRTPRSIANAGYLLANVGAYFDSHWWDAIEAVQVERYLNKRVAEGLSPSSRNKDLGILEQMYTQMRRWIDLKKIRPVVMPEKDFTAPIQRLTENERKRVPDTFELADAYMWCQENRPKLWYAIEKALETALRKQDLIALDGSLTVKGIQQKTGEAFDLPLTLEHTVEWSKRDWNALRDYMNWQLQPHAAHTRPHKHTTWHDLRHWAPTLLGEKGFSTKIIQNYTGHASEAMAERYTNTRRKALEPYVEIVKNELKQLKASVVKGNVIDN